ncbi:hypothetical protein ACFVUS_19885 [Nocardia sp. NPDC058058]|uniref:hypothetical protein n=1 Tax=Nocardia sp. NPDC058058 TaxID=3346317 RepID=UPI0036D98D0F
MKFSRFTPLAGACTIAALVGVAVLTPTSSTAQAAPADGTLAEVTVSDVDCATGAPTFDNVITAAASALRTVVPPTQLVAYDQQVNEFRQTVAATRIHRNLLPVDPGTVAQRLDDIDDPIVTYIVNGLDAVRTGRMDTTVTVSELTVNDAIEVFVLSNRIVRIPTQMAANMVPRVGYMLRGMVGGMFKGVHRMARVIQDRVGDTCNLPNSYAPLDLSFTDDEIYQSFDVPAHIEDLANQLVLANDDCRPASGLSTRQIFERTRTFLANHPDLPVDRDSLNNAHDSIQAFLRDHHVAGPLVMRPVEELGPIPNAIDYGPLTFLTNLGFDIQQGRLHETVPLADVSIENSGDLAYATLDSASLLISLASMAAGIGGIASSAVLTPINIAKVMAFAPAKYGWPIMRGVLRSMCAAE